MENFADIDIVYELLHELERLIKETKLLSALFIALTIPDSLGKIAYPEISKVNERYIKWFDENVRNYFGYLYSKPLGDGKIRFSGKECYQLRCKLLHESTNDIAEKTGIDEFVLSFGNERVLTGNTAGGEPHPELWRPEMDEIPATNYLYLGVKEVCIDILEAAELFVKNHPNLDYPTLRINVGGGKIPRALKAKRK